MVHVEHTSHGRSIITTGYAIAANGERLCRVGMLVLSAHVPAMLRTLEKLAKPPRPLFVDDDEEAVSGHLKMEVGR